jgi:predicted esterase
MKTPPHNKRIHACISALFITLTLCSTGIAQTRPGSIDDGSISQKALLLTVDGPEGRRLRFRGPDPDPIHAKLANGSLSEFHPSEGDSLPGVKGSSWKSVDLSENGSTEERGLYLDLQVTMKEAGALILSTSGSETYVNGAPRAGNVYGYNYVEVPIALNEGLNHVLLRSGRKPLRAHLSNPPSPVSASDKDMTLPDLVAGDFADTWGALIVRNTTHETAQGFTLSVSGSGFDETPTQIPNIPPMSLLKAGFRIRCIAPQTTGELETSILLKNRDGMTDHQIKATFKVLTPDQTRRITFVSAIDGSVQYYALRPASSSSANDPPPAIVLSCHGASVEGRGQAAAYGPKRWFHIVAPTNRRPYGFDWEDFGRMDAMEVLSLSKASLRHDPSRIYLTGHSMGGHGAWHLAVTYPDQFAAVGPSAGWISRSTYGRRRRDKVDASPLESLIKRSTTPSETQGLATNLKHLGVYILHGGSDNNVPPSQAQTMAELLEGMHNDWYYHEEPDKNHWWSNDFGDNGSACVDWPFMFDSFARHALPPSSAVRQVEFATANPGISSTCHWLEIMQQEQHSAVSKVNLHLWPNKRQVRGTTENIALLKLDLSHMSNRDPISLEIDEQTLEDVPQPSNGSLYLERKHSQWSVVNKPSPSHKGPHRYGGPKDVLDHRFLFVYGTKGDAAENTWAFQKARFDAETYWYRGNASVECIPDTQFTLDAYKDRSLVLYGNATTNGAWTALLNDSPIQVNSDSIRIGAQLLNGKDLSTLFVRPRPDSDRASVVVITGTGLPGMRATYQQTLFLPFVRFADCVVKRQGKQIAGGYFGNDWSFETGEFEFESQEGL